MAVFTLWTTEQLSTKIAENAAMYVFIVPKFKNRSFRGGPVFYYVERSKLAKLTGSDQTPGSNQKHSWARHQQPTLNI